MGVYTVGLTMSKTKESKRNRERRKEGQGNPSKKRKHALGKYEGKINKKSILCSISPFIHRTDYINVPCKSVMQPFKHMADFAEEPLPSEGSARGAQHTLAAQSSVISRNHSHGSR